MDSKIPSLASVSLDAFLSVVKLSVCRFAVCANLSVMKRSMQVILHSMHSRRKLSQVSIQLDDISSLM